MSIQGKMKNDYSIEYIIDYTEPIELGVFTNALEAFSLGYKKHISQNYEGQQPSDAKLHIQKISEGSIITTLVEYANQTLPFLSDMNTVKDFGTSLMMLATYFKGGRKSEKPIYDLQDLDNLSKIVAPATYGDNSTKIDITGDNNTILVLSVNNDEANSMTNQIAIAKKELIEPTQRIYTKQAFYWEQAKKDIKSKTGNFGIIENISSNKMSVIFDDDDLKKQMIVGEQNPFKTTYIVDVEAQYVREQIKIYKILKLHEIIEDE